MTYLEYSIAMDKLDLKFDLSIMNEDIYQESVGSFFNKLINSIVDYISDCKDLVRLYNEKRKLNVNAHYLMMACKDKNIANQEIYVRGYNGKITNDLSLEDTITFLNNMIVYTNLKMYDAKMSEYLEKYELMKSPWDTYYVFKLKDVYDIYVYLNDRIMSYIDQLKTSLKKFSMYYKNASDTNNFNIDIFKKFIFKIRDIIKKNINNMVLSYELMRFDVNSKIKDVTKAVSDKVVLREPSNRTLRKDSVFVKEMTHNGITYKIYKTSHKNVSEFNYRGYSIYVTDDFFDLPKGYQLAILYHEIGHTENKHFKPENFKKYKTDLELEDNRKILNRLVMDYRKYLYTLRSSKFNMEEAYNNGDYFLYLLLEWEADRYAANILSKNIVSKALTRGMDIDLRTRTYKDPEKAKLYYDYNMDRMRIRTANI